MGGVGPAATFASRQKFRQWLEKNHCSVPELLVRCYKVAAAEKGLTYREALDEALCFGWIDGVRRSLDQDSFSTRFTPRKSKSYWSAVNIRRATELASEGRLHAAGRAAFAARDARKPERYSFENKPKELDPSLKKRLRANKRAWSFFQAQAPWYQRTSIFWIMQAKREETRGRRLAELIARSAKQEPIKLLDRKPRSATPKR
ncbi:MAG TPA: YdeI/OmpD-associated family protein [Gemmatimonadales bacterium]|nr:YdeI/OmpD-associated family protein [Gemmatimonadales bacterium]